MIYANPSLWLAVPASVALCPQCGDELVVWLDEWDARTGEVTEVGFTTECSGDNDAGDGDHQYWYDEWIQIDQLVYAWLSAEVRVDLSFYDAGQEDR